MKASIIMVSSLFLLCPTIGVCEGVSHTVTPDNIDDMELDFKVTYNRTTYDLVGFSVYISSGKTKLSPRTEGLLEVRQGKQRIVSCAVEGVRVSGVLNYKFIVGSDWISSSYLIFSNLKGHFTEVYRFKVADFEVVKEE